LYLELRTLRTLKASFDLEKKPHAFKKHDVLLNKKKKSTVHKRQTLQLRTIVHLFDQQVLFFEAVTIFPMKI